VVAVSFLLYFFHLIFINLKGLFDCLVLSPQDERLLQLLRYVLVGFLHVDKLF
jgi:hypothetical protein